MIGIFGVVVSVVVAQGTPSTPACAIDSTAPWAQVNRAWSTGGGRWSNDSLRRVLIALEREDQEARREFSARSNDSSYQRRLIAIDRQLSDTVAGLLDRFGLPTRSLVGPTGTTALFTIVQHSATLQERVLAMAREAAAGEVPPHAVATLEDRVLVRQGKPQRYGTHFSFGTGGLLRFDPVDDTRGLAIRRRDAGLPPMDLYVCLLEESGLKVDRASLPSPGQRS